MYGTPIPGASSNRSRLQSCAIGCGVLILVVVVGAVTLYYWAVTPGRQVPTDFILGANSLALMHVDGLQDDPALRALVARLISDIQSARSRQVQREDLPWFLRMLLGRQREVGEREVDKTLGSFPRDVTVTLEDVPGADEPRIAVAVNLNRYPRVLRLIFSVVSLYQDSRTFQGYRLLRLGRAEEGVVTFVQHTAVWAQSPDTLEQVLSRRAEALENAEDAHVLQAYNRRDRRWNLYGVIENREGTLAWLVRRTILPRKAEVSSDELEARLVPVVRVRFGIDIVDDDSLEGQIEIDSRGREEAVELASLIEEGFTEALAAKDFGILELERGVRQSGETVIITLIARNIREEIVRRIEEAKR